MSKDHLSIDTFRKLSTANKKISNKNRQKIKQKIFIHTTQHSTPARPKFLSSYLVTVLNEGCVVQPIRGLQQMGFGGGG